MNIQFHYFVIRFLTKSLGFDDKTSQIIATTSQFIDDSDKKEPVHLIRADISGKKIEERGLYSNDGKGIVVHIPKSIHETLDDFGDPTEEFIYQDTEHICWKSMVPFHYPPLEPLNYKDRDCLAYQVEAPHEYYSGTVFRELTDYAISQYLGKAAEKDTEQETSIRIGAITHMLADSFAHTSVNGLISKQINDCSVLQVLDGDFSKYLTDKYKISDEEKERIPYVGQYKMKTVMDDCYIRATISHDGLPVPVGVTFDNLDNSMAAAKCIYNFYLKLLEKSDDGYSIWEGTYAPVIRSMLSFRNTDTAELIKKWTEKCPDISFSYSKGDIMEKLKSEAYREYLYGAAVVADDMRNEVLYEYKAKVLYVTNSPYGSVSFSKVEYSNGKLRISATGIAEKLQTPSKLILILLNSGGQQVDSQTFTKVEDGNSITGVLEYDLTVERQEFTLKASLHTDKGSTTESRKYIIEDTSSLIVCKSNNLKELDKDSLPVIYNMVSMIEKKVSYPDNADYFNQDNNRVIDIMLPVDADFTLASDFIFDSVSAMLKLADETNNFIHCGNIKLNSISFNEDRSVCSIKFKDEWKNHLPLDTYFKKMADFTLSIRLDVKITAREESQFSGSRSFIWESYKDVFPEIKMTWATDARAR